MALQKVSIFNRFLLYVQVAAEATEAITYMVKVIEEVGRHGNRVDGCLPVLEISLDDLKGRQDDEDNWIGCKKR
ncbi:MAG: hypothetical protein K2W95_31570 [Candidatus Obscuribacterales bacterium]|nr:hypothetical protein [Candidatus Obscuribacterales bacterium]